MAKSITATVVENKMMNWKDRYEKIMLQEHLACYGSGTCAEDTECPVQKDCIEECLARIFRLVRG